MALISIIKDFHPHNYAKLLDKAAELAPSLRHTIVEPVGGFVLKERYSPEREEIVLHKAHHLAMGKGQNLCLDFGTHVVGYPTLHLTYTGSHPDAPAFLKLKFAETIGELSENSGDYDGWVSSSWIQEEYVHVDVLPAEIALPRRYAFRYLKITMMDTSPKYKLIVKRAECRTESSADWSKVPQRTSGDAQLDRIRAVSLRTLANCMQDVFEDGPKRDRRLWMGDLRLQALTNYVSFKNYDLVKRCLYLFAGSRFPDGRVSACIFTKPSVEADDTWLFDYSLLFTIALDDYLRETNDEEALHDLYDVAMQQIELALSYCGPDHLLNEEACDAAFIDWTEGLDKHAAAQAVLICAIRSARRLARRKNDWSQGGWLMEQEDTLKKAALAAFWDAERGCFLSCRAERAGDGSLRGEVSERAGDGSPRDKVSERAGDGSPRDKVSERAGDGSPRGEVSERAGDGSPRGEVSKRAGDGSPRGQISVASQVWMTLADVLPPEEARTLMEHALEIGSDFPMMTPYMHHYYVMALLRTGLREQALQHIRDYWGSMIEAGADTFWEAWNPSDPGASPYGGRVINSYCHAWSCTPAYIMEEMELLG